MRITVTDLEAYRRFRSQEDMPLHVLLAQLRRETPPSAAMAAGTALHSILETATDGELTTATVDGHTFRFTVEGELRLAPVRELAGARTYYVDGVPVTLRGRVDALPGNGVEDHKLTGRAFDAIKYADSYQWRAYLSIFGAQWFAYNVFEGQEVETSEDGVLWDVTGFHRLVLYRYPELETDLLAEIGRYVEFARQHLPETIAA